MKHWSLNAWNDWRTVTSGFVDVTLLRLNLYCMRGHFVSGDFMLLGLGFSLSYYPNGRDDGANWGAVIGAAMSCWEPIEHDGHAGEPQGREHGA